MQGLRHPNVVGFFGVSLDEGNKGTIVLEYCEGKQPHGAVASRLLLAVWVCHNVCVAARWDQQHHLVSPVVYRAGRDLQSALHLRTSRTQERVFGWYRSGRRVAFEVAKALNFLHSKVWGHITCIWYCWYCSTAASTCHVACAQGLLPLPCPPPLILSWRCSPSPLPCRGWFTLM